MVKVLVLAYHRVYPGYHIDPGTFDYHVRVLKERFVPLSLDEVVGFAKGEFHPQRDSVVITFDDGWADNYIYAYPILRKHGLRGAIFLTTKYPLALEPTRPTLKDYWDNRVGYHELLQCRDMDAIVGDLSHEGSPDFLTWGEVNLIQVEGAIQVESHGHTHAYAFCSPEIVDFCRPRLTGRVNWLRLSDGICLEPGAPLYKAGSVLAHPRYFEDQDLTQDLVDFVRSHGGESFFSQKDWRKVLLSRVRSWWKNNQQKGHMEPIADYYRRFKEEMERSIALIERHTGRRPRHLAWPFGEYNMDTMSIAKEMGFIACYTTKQGFIKIGDCCYELHRFSPPRNKRMFLMALRGTIGMGFYRGSLNVLHTWRGVRLSKCKAGFY